MQTCVPLLKNESNSVQFPLAEEAFENVSSFPRSSQRITFRPQRHCKLKYVRFKLSSSRDRAGT